MSTPLGIKGVQKYLLDWHKPAHAKKIHQNRSAKSRKDDRQTHTQSEWSEGDVSVVGVVVVLGPVSVV